MGGLQEELAEAQEQVRRAREEADSVRVAASVAAARAEAEVLDRQQLHSAEVQELRSQLSAARCAVDSCDRTLRSATICAGIICHAQGADIACDVQMVRLRVAGLSMRARWHTRPPASAS